jgi:hypothetical protein
MSMAKPVIATGYSGNLDFMTPANSFPVRYRLVELQQDYQPFHYKKGCVWADPDLDHAAELMRFVYENRKSAEQVGRKARQDVLQSLHPRAVGRLIKERLSRLAALGKVAALPSAADGQKAVPAIAGETEGNPKRGIGNPK